MISTNQNQVLLISTNRKQVLPGSNVDLVVLLTPSLLIWSTDPVIIINIIIDQLLQINYLKHWSHCLLYTRGKPLQTSVYIKNN